MDYIGSYSRATRLCIGSFEHGSYDLGLLAGILSTVEGPFYQPFFSQIPPGRVL